MRVAWALATFSWLISFLFFFNDTATTEIYTLSLHDALPISAHDVLARRRHRRVDERRDDDVDVRLRAEAVVLRVVVGPFHRLDGRSEEHTSELQSHSDLVCRLLLEKKKKRKFATH